MTPAKKLAGNVKSFFGHYKQNGVNVQAVCDHHCRFTFLAIAAPGSANDRVAVKETNLPALLRNLPVGYVLIAYAGYNLDEHIVPMYSGAQRLYADYDNFNYLASQCRIRVEIAFGLLTTKWGILGRPISVKLTQLKFVLLSIARLHNFTINERLLAGSTSEDEEIVVALARQAPLFDPSQPMDPNGNPIFYLKRMGHSMDNLWSKGIPQYVNSWLRKLEQLV